MTLALITSCSNRKSLSAGARINAQCLSEGNHIEVANAWAEKVKKLRPTIEACELYNSRGATIARRLGTEDHC